MENTDSDEEKGKISRHIEWCQRWKTRIQRTRAAKSAEILSYIIGANTNSNHERGKISRHIKWHHLWKILIQTKKTAKSADTLNDANGGKHESNIRERQNQQKYWVISSVQIQIQITTANSADILTDVICG